MNTLPPRWRHSGQRQRLRLRVVDRTVAPWPVMLVLDCFSYNANLTHSCCDVHECMFSAIISVAYAHNLPCHTVQSCECNCSMHVLRHAHALHSGSPPNVLHSPSIIVGNNYGSVWNGNKVSPYIQFSWVNSHLPQSSVTSSSLSTMQIMGTECWKRKPVYKPILLACKKVYIGWPSSACMVQSIRSPLLPFLLPKARHYIPCAQRSS